MPSVTQLTAKAQAGRYSADPALVMARMFLLLGIVIEALAAGQPGLVAHGLAALAGLAALLAVMSRGSRAASQAIRPMLLSGPGRPLILPRHLFRRS